VSVAGAPVRVAVMGSCVTRDNFNSRFNPGYKSMYETVLMQNQSSVISLMSPGFALTDDEIGPANEYDRWNVVTDVTKSFLADLGELQPEYLLLDFFADVHFGVLETGDGRWITNNRWKLWPTPYYQTLKDSGPLRVLSLDRDTEVYLDLWRESFDRFAAHVKRVAPNTTVVVHHGQNASTLVRPGGGSPVPLQENTNLSKIDIARYNELWSQLDDYATASTGFASIDLTDQKYSTMTDHPWGPYYVHYTMDYYVDFLTALNRLHLGRTLGSPEHDMVQQLLVALEERQSAVVGAATAANKRQRAQLKKQAERIKVLEQHPTRQILRSVQRRVQGRTAKL
jgi:hypothetical protein